MAGAHENRVVRRDRLLVDALAFEARLEVGERDLLADVEDRPFTPWPSNRTPRVKKGRAFSIPSFLSPYGDHISESRLPL
jgi:hypothetical protein